MLRVDADKCNRSSLQHALFSLGDIRTNHSREYDSFVGIGNNASWTLRPFKNKTNGNLCWSLNFSSKALFPQYNPIHLDDRVGQITGLVRFRLFGEIEPIIASVKDFG